MKAKPSRGAFWVVVPLLVIVSLRYSQESANVTWPVEIFEQIPASQAFWKKAEIETSNYCKHLFPVLRNHFPSLYALRTNMAVLNTTLDVYAYAENDFVSDQILHASGWDMEKATEMLNQLERYRAAKGLRADQVTFVDIGANIAWFSSIMAHHGFRVISFEPMSQNEILVRSNMCLFDPEGEKKTWTYFNLGLGESTSSCKIISHGTNFGDGLTVCDDARVGDGYVVRSHIDIVRLDDVLSNYELANLEIGFVKVDVENFEKFVVAGGPEFFASPKVTRMFIEFFPMNSPKCAERNRDVYTLLTKAGWKLSFKAFGGPLADPNVLHGDTIADAFAWKE